MSEDKLSVGVPYVIKLTLDEGIDSEAVTVDGGGRMDVERISEGLLVIEISVATELVAGPTIVRGLRALLGAGGGFNCCIVGYGGVERTGMTRDPDEVTTLQELLTLRVVVAG